MTPSSQIDMTVLKQEIIIPEEPMEIPIRLKIEGENTNSPFLGLNYNESYGVSINGIDGRIYVTAKWVKGNEYYYYYTFKRLGTGDKVTIPEGSKVIIQQSHNENYIPIIFVGENEEPFDNPEKIYQNIDLLIETTTNLNNRFIVMSFFQDERKGLIEEAESLLREKFGDNYINVRKLLLDVGTYENYHYSLTETEIAKIEIGEIPYSIMKNNVTMSDIGNELLAKIVYDKMTDIGYFKELLEVSTQ